MKRIVIRINIEVDGDLMDDEFDSLKNQILSGKMQADIKRAGMTKGLRKVIATYIEEKID